VVCNEVRSTVLVAGHGRYFPSSVKAETGQGVAFGCGGGGGVVKYSGDANGGGTPLIYWSDWRVISDSERRFGDVTNNHSKTPRTASR
jgi:hypothetical protein